MSRLMRGLALCAGLLAAFPGWADEALWAQLAQGGYILLIRHAATEPGTGDPPGFRLGDCATQRNLSATGRAEARRLGTMIKQWNIPVAVLRSSPWCRCIETAQLAFGQPTTWEALGSLFNDPREETRKTRTVLDALRDLPTHGNVVLVTHNFNIRALTGVSPQQGETIVTQMVDGTLQVVERLPLPVER